MNLLRQRRILTNGADAAATFGAVHKRSVGHVRDAPLEHGRLVVAGVKLRQRLPRRHGHCRVVDLVVPVAVGKVSGVANVHALIGEKGLGIPAGRRLFPGALLDPCRCVVDGLPIAAVVTPFVRVCVRIDGSVAPTHGGVLVEKAAERLVVGELHVHGPRLQAIVQRVPAGAPVRLSRDHHVVPLRLQHVMDLLAVVARQPLVVVPGTLNGQPSARLQVADVVGVPPAPDRRP